MGPLALKLEESPEFVKAAIAYKNKGEMEMKRKKIVRSFSIARKIYSGGLESGLQPIKDLNLKLEQNSLMFGRLSFS
ncbi:hypothetical protein ACE6H2_006379 [Prunus campanulata]